MGNRIYGCDDCLAVCPWNRFARATRHDKLRAARRPHARRVSPNSPRWTMPVSGACSPARPIKRIGRDRFVRNVLIAIGNAACPALRPAAARLTSGPRSRGRRGGRWALARLPDGATLKRRREGSA